MKAAKASKERRDAVLFLYRFVLAAKTAKAAHFAVEKGSEIDLADRIQGAGRLAAEKRLTEELSKFERWVRLSEQQRLAELHQMIHRAITTNDSGFFRRLSKASLLAKRGIEQKPRGAKQAAVLSIWELHGQLGRMPTRDEVIDAVERWRNTTRLTKKQWDNVFQDSHISAILRCS